MAYIQIFMGMWLRRSFLHSDNMNATCPYKIIISQNNETSFKWEAGQFTNLVYCFSLQLKDRDTVNKSHLYKEMENRMASMPSRIAFFLEVTIWEMA